MIKGEEILNYIPQRTPIVMIDTFFGLKGDDNSSTALTIAEDNLFVDKKTNKFQDSGLIEHIAQSCAMHIGYESVTRGEGIPLGFIGSVNKLTIYRLPNAGEILNTSVCFEVRMGNIIQAGTAVHIGEEKIAECKMKLAVVDQ